VWHAISSAPVSRATSPTQQLVSCEVGGVAAVMRARSQRLAHATRVRALTDVAREVSRAVAVDRVVESAARRGEEAKEAFSSLDKEVEGLEEAGSKRDGALEAMESVVGTLATAAQALHAESDAVVEEAQERWRQLERHAVFAVRALREVERGERQRRVENARVEEAERGRAEVRRLQREREERLAEVRRAADRKAEGADAHARHLSGVDGGEGGGGGGGVEGGDAKLVIGELQTALAVAREELREWIERAEQEAREQRRVERTLATLLQGGREGGGKEGGGKEGGGEVLEVVEALIGATAREGEGDGVVVVGSSAEAEVVAELAQEAMPDGAAVVDWVLNDVEAWALAPQGQGQGEERELLGWMVGEEQVPAAKRALVTPKQVIADLYEAELRSLLQGPLHPSPTLRRAMEDVAAGEVFAAEAEGREGRQATGATLRQRLRQRVAASPRSARGIGADALGAATPAELWELRALTGARLRHDAAREPAEDLRSRQHLVHGPQ
jgi:hypothetical protein